MRSFIIFTYSHIIVRIIKRRSMRRVVHSYVTRMWNRKPHKILLGNLKRKVTRKTHRWKNMELDVRDVGCRIVIWIQLTQERIQ